MDITSKEFESIVKYTFDQGRKYGTNWSPIIWQGDLPVEQRKTIYACYAMLRDWRPDRKGILVKIEEGGT